MSHGKVLDIDLSNYSYREYSLSDEVLSKYVGGSGLASKIIYDHIRRSGKLEPFTDDNILVFAVGPLTGTGFPLTSRYFVAGISPLTNIYGQASSGGRFGSELRRCGYSALVIRGRAHKPTLIKVSKKGIELLDASKLWGRGTYETQELIRREFPGCSIACIGPAGEHLVRYAAIINDEGRAAGRTGLGAVMGYKMLKAVAVKGWIKPEVKNYNAFNEAMTEAIEAIKKSSAAKVLHDYGTSGMIESLHELGDVPIKNFSMGEWSRESIRKLSGQTLAKTYLIRRYHCEACPIGCGRVVNVDEVIIDGPEYESVAALGTLLLNDDLRTVLLANHLCNDLGLDTISTGVTLAFTIECVEKGIIESHELNISWSPGRKILELIKKIAVREGIGDLLAEGVARMSMKLGQGCESFAMHVKGLEMPMHDPRAFESWALAYATSNRGACHTYAPTYYIEKGLTFPEIGLSEPLDRFEVRSKPKAVKLIQDMTEFLDSMVMCRFCLYGGIKLPVIIKALNAVLGTNYSVSDVLLIGERIFNTKRLINNIQGVRKKDDTLPPRIFTPPNPLGGTSGHIPNLSENLVEYYRLRGWNEDGVVTTDKLVELGIEL